MSYVKTISWKKLTFFPVYNLDSGRLMHCNLMIHIFRISTCTLLDKKIIWDLVALLKHCYCIFFQDGSNNTILGLALAYSSNFIKYYKIRYFFSRQCDFVVQDRPNIDSKAIIIHKYHKNERQKSYH